MINVLAGWRLAALPRLHRGPAATGGDEARRLAWEQRLAEAVAELEQREAGSAEMTQAQLAALAAERVRLAAELDNLARSFDHAADERDLVAEGRDVAAARRDRWVRERTGDLDAGFGDRFVAAEGRDHAAGDRADARADRRRAAEAREAAARDRGRAAAELRAATARHEELNAELAGLRAALATRQLIGQAVGMLMERHDLDEQAAFAVLAALSQSQNVKLRDVAQAMLATKTAKPNGSAPADPGRDGGGR